ncbi:MAG: hypothetical protein GXY01_03590 [Clostridiales bacterium]|nr:hypothetical protein [Clostridiales bacterium]
MGIMRTTRRAVHNNKGSAVITVVIAMLFVAALGTALLYAAYMGYQIAITERGNKENFYQCSTAMDDIRTGIQNSVTQALAAAYTNTLTKYAVSGEDFDTHTEFSNEFLYRLSLSKVKVNDFDALLFDSAQESGKTKITAYYPSRLSSYTNTPPETLSLGFGGNYEAVTGEVIENTDAGRLLSITMKAISVKFTENGYESEIISDITINIPDFFAKTPTAESLNNCAIIAEGTLVQNSGTNTVINGDIYSGGISVTGEGNRLTFSNSNVISKGDITVSNGGELVYNAPKYELWANKIAAGSPVSGGYPSTIGKLDLSGKIFVADDLVLDGNKGTSVKLQGSYFGFGDGNTPSNSSAIIVNGRDTALDISKLDRLSLAGVSFISIAGQGLNEIGGESYSVPIPMGESLSVKSNQLAYLVPDECINYPSNPYIFSGPIDPLVCEPDTVLWGTKKLSDYLGGGKGEIKALYKNISENEKIAYVFMVFSKHEYANAYFRDYFAAYPEKIEQYLSLYTALSGKSSDAYFDTAGNTFYVSNAGGIPEDDKLTLIPANEKVWTDGVKARYSRMTSPFGDFVNEEALNALPAETELNFVDDNNKTLAIISNKKAVEYVSPSSSIKLIISTNDVSIRAKFSGMILTKGNITVSANIDATGFDSNMVGAHCDINGVRYKLSDFVLSSALSGASSNEYSENSWSPDKLVVYENWTNN